MPHAARGAHVFRPSQQTQGVASSLLPPPIRNDVDDEAETDSASGDEQLPAAPLATSRQLPPIATNVPTLRSTASTSVTGSSGRSKRKRSALDDEQSGSRRSSLLTSASHERKKRGPSATVALHGLKEGLDLMNDNLSVLVKGVGPPVVDTSPERRTKAMEKIQKDEPNLDLARLTALVDLFKQDTTAADTYLALFREDVRRYWVEKQLIESLGFPALSPMDLTE